MGSSSSKNKPPAELAQHCTAGIAIERTSYVAGEIIRGYVQVEIRAPIRCENVFCYLACDAKTKVHYTTHSGSGKHRRTHHHYAHERQAVHLLRAHVAQFSGAQAQPGNYQFPFEFHLPAEAPSSLHIDEGANHCFVTHCVRVELQGCGNNRAKQSQSWPIQSVLFNVNSAPPTGEPTAQSEIQPVTACCCLSKGTIGLDSQLVSNTCQIGGNIGITYSVRNSSNAECSGVIVSIRECATWSARGHWRRYDRPALENKVHDIVGANVSVGPFTGQIVLPLGSCHPSMNLEQCNISVDHRLRVQAKTACCVTDPYNDTSICVHEGPPTVAVLSAQAVQLGAVLNQTQGSDSSGVDKGGVSVPIVQAMPYNPASNSSANGVFTSPQMTGIPMDTTGDGIANAIGYDTTGDGVVDSLDTNMDGKIDSFIGAPKQSVQPSAPPTRL